MATTRTTRSKRAAPDDAPASLTSPSTAAPKRPTKAPARKRARLDVEDHELKPATGIEEHRCASDTRRCHRRSRSPGQAAVASCCTSLTPRSVPFADADVYYVPDLVDEAQAQLWHDELAQLSTWYRASSGRRVKALTHLRADAQGLRTVRCAGSGCCLTGHCLVSLSPPLSAQADHSSERSRRYVACDAGIACCHRCSARYAQSSMSHAPSLDT